jgi:hypothetical protein
MFNRKFIMITAVSLASLMPAANVEAQKSKPSSCSDIPVWVTILPTDDGILSGDAKGTVYKADVDGVSAKINVCGTSPTYDATLWLSNSVRTLGLTFPRPIDGSIISGQPPVWANGSTFAAKPLLYVRNILWGRMNGQYTFTTRLILKSISGPGDRNLYDLRLQPYLVDSLTSEPPNGDTNLPQETATVTVQDIAGTCRSTVGGTLDSWIITVDSPYVGTLHLQASKGKSESHSGQYQSPFRLLIEARSCVPASLTR